MRDLASSGGWRWPIWLLCALLLVACSTPGALPELSLRALGVLHRRHSSSMPGRGLDLALTMQLSFRPHVQRHPRVSYFVPDPADWLDVSCSDPWLCDWALTAEQSTLLALGVPP